MNELSSYIGRRNWKILIKARADGRQFLSCPLEPQVQPAFCFNVTIGLYNQTRSGDLGDPINAGGASMMSIAGTGHESDGCFMLEERTLRCKNAITETHFRAAETLTDFNSRLRNYIMATSGVVLTVGFKIFEHEGNEFAAVVVVYQRAAAVAGMSLANPIILSHISFGTQALTAQELAGWNADVVGGQFAPAAFPMIGVGFAGAGGLPALNTAATPYFLNIPEGLFLMDNADPAMPVFRAAAPLFLENPAGAVLGGNIQFNLYHFQRCIFRGMVIVIVC